MSDAGARGVLFVMHSRVQDEEPAVVESRRCLEERDRRVVRIAAGIKPWRAALAKRSRSVLELAAGEAARIGLQPGNVLQLEVQG